jgi:hypothetical protein
MIRLVQTDQTAQSDFLTLNVREDVFATSSMSGAEIPVEQSIYTEVVAVAGVALFTKTELFEASEAARALLAQSQPVSNMVREARAQLGMYLSNAHMELDVLFDPAGGPGELFLSVRPKCEPRNAIQQFRRFESE